MDKSLWLDFDYSFKPYIQQIYERAMCISYIVDDPARLLAAMAQVHADGLGDWLEEVNVIEKVLTSLERENMT